MPVPREETNFSPSVPSNQEQTGTVDPGARANADACAGGAVTACTRQSLPGFGGTLRLLPALGTPRPA